ncbi:MAG: hypothetical protein U0790_10745 [Isosphaeraceae bacterium]
MPDASVTVPRIRKACFGSTVIFSGPVTSSRETPMPLLVAPLSFAAARRAIGPGVRPSRRNVPSGAVRIVSRMLSDRFTGPVS